MVILVKSNFMLNCFEPVLSGGIKVMVDSTLSWPVGFTIFPSELN